MENWRKISALGSKFIYTFNLFITATLRPGANNLWYVPFPVGGYTNIGTLEPEHIKMFVFKSCIKSWLEIR